MCGFAGILDPSGRIDLAAALDRTRPMLEPRGPDGHARIIDDRIGCGLDHHRLAIFDRDARGQQPMSSPSGRFTIVFNGSIYDHPEHRRDLERTGVTFRTETDTEVLLAGFEAWGVSETLQRVDGMFAFGLVDRGDRRLILARDRAGQKPILFARAGGALAFASDLEALEAMPAPFEKKLHGIDDISLRWFLRLGVVPWPRSIRPGVEHLDPGGLASFDLETLHVVRTAWYTPPPPQVDSIVSPEPDRATIDVVRASVHRQCRADRPVGVMLSAGLDSRLVAGLAAEVVDDLPCFTLAMPGAFDESVEAARIVDRIGGVHRVVRPTDEEVAGRVRDLQRITSEPFADSSLIPTSLLASAARERIVVALGGDGGDELFGGYRRHQAAWRRTTMPSRLALLCAGIVDLIPESITGRINIGRFTLRDLARRRACIGPKGIDLLGLRSLQGDADALLQSFAERGPIRIDEARRGPTEDQSIPWDGVMTPPSDVRSLMRADFRQYLPDDPLVKVDVAAMAVALEYRAPLLGAEVVDHAMGLPTSTLFDHRGGRAPVRRALDELGLGSESPKRGFAAPLARWLRGPLREYAGDLLAWEASDLLSEVRLQKVWNEFLRGRNDHATAIWTVVSWRGWLRSRLEARSDRRSTAGS